MNPPADASQTVTGNEPPLDPHEAAELLDQTTQQARRTFATHVPPLLWIYRAFFVLVVLGGCWLSARHQDPYTGPTSAIIPVTVVLVAINIAWSAAAIRRSSAGVSGPTQRKTQAWMGLMLVVLVVAYAITAPLYHAGTSHPTWGLYPASTPWMIIGVIGAATAAVRHAWSTAAIVLAIAIVAVVAGFGGPAGSWLMMGIGLSAVCLCTAAYLTWQRRRGLVGS